MSLTKKEVEHLAELARIDLTQEELNKFQKQLSSILDYVDKLKKVDTKKVDDNSSAVKTENVFRDDLAAPFSKTKKLLEAAPSKFNDFYRVKTVFK